MKNLDPELIELSNTLASEYVESDRYEDFKNFFEGDRRKEVYGNSPNLLTLISKQIPACVSRFTKKIFEELTATDQEHVQHYVIETIKWKYYFNAYRVDGYELSVGEFNVLNMLREKYKSNIQEIKEYLIETDSYIRIQ